MKPDQKEEEEKPVNLNKHRRYEKKTPRKLLIKAAVIMILFYLVKTGIDIIIEKQASTKIETQKNTEVEIEVEE